MVTCLLNFITGKAAEVLIAFPFEFQFVGSLNWFDYLVRVAEYQFHVSFLCLSFLAVLLYFRVFKFHGIPASFSHAFSSFGSLISFCTLLDGSVGTNRGKDDRSD